MDNITMHFVFHKYKGSREDFIRSDTFLLYGYTSIGLHRGSKPPDQGAINFIILVEDLKDLMDIIIMH